MVPVAEFEPGVCVQSPTKTVRNPVTGVSVIVKLPGADVTSWSCPSPRVNEDG